MNTKLLFVPLVLMLWSSPTFAQETRDSDRGKQEQAQDTTEADETSAQKESQEKEDSASSDRTSPEEENVDIKVTFDPSEDISEDYAPPFPTDI